MAYLIEEFIEDTNACSNREEAFELYQKAIGQFGFDSAVYTFITDHKAADIKAKHAVQCNFPEDWMKHYVANDYQSIDPAIVYAFRTRFAFSWDDLQKKEFITKTQRNILNQAQEAGLNDGVGIPIYGPGGEMAGVGLAGSTKGINPDKAMLSKLKLFTEQLHMVYCSLDGDTVLETNPTTEPLTARETEVLKWWAVGKTKEEIGMILNCSQSNIKRHIESIYKKLNANSQILAVIKAIHLGYIQLDLIEY